MVSGAPLILIFGGDKLIEIRNVTKRYGSGDNTCMALNDFSAKIPTEKFTAIVGKSGSGKTTLLNMIGLIDSPDTGEILISGVDILKYSENERRVFRRTGVGIVFQFFYLLPCLNCEENILIANEKAPKYDAEYYAEIVECLEINKLLRKYPDQISGGEQQRVAIARALINRPGLLLCDEPTGNLDSENAERVVSLLETVTRRYNMTMIMVTHDQEIAHRADYVLCMKDGFVGGDLNCVEK